jgi:hypothetical protein
MHRNKCVINTFQSHSQTCWKHGWTHTIKMFQQNIKTGEEKLKWCLVIIIIDWLILVKHRVSEMCQSCQTWAAKFGQILLSTDTSMVFCSRKLMRTDIFFTRTTKPICNFVNPVNVQQAVFQLYSGRASLFFLNDF